MLSSDQLTKYRDHVLAECGRPSILLAKSDIQLKNCSNSTGIVAPLGLSWIDYWRAMTRNHSSQLRCCSCGRVVFVGSVPAAMCAMYKMTGDNPETHRACEGHVFVNGHVRTSLLGGRYIVPVCPECKSENKGNILIKAGTNLCKEVIAKENV